MIAAAAVQAAGSASGIAEKILAFVAQAKASAADGLTWAEFGQLLLAMLRLVTSTLDQFDTLSGAEKKAMALEAVGLLFDGVADRCVPLVAYPFWVLARPAIRSLVLAIASGAIEQLLPLVRVAT
jgi:hypothetical protein